MEFLSNDGRPLATLADWRDRGAPVTSKRWVEGGSARELARAWIEGDAADRLTELLATVPAFAGLVLQRGIAEKETRFDATASEPSRHDLLLTAGAPTGQIVVGVQGMAEEPSIERLDVMATRAGREPLDRLTSAFFGTTLDEDALLAPLSYRLLAGLATTLADAREQRAPHAVFLVHEFETPWTDAALHRRNAEDVEAFAARLLPGVERATDDRAWIAGPKPVDATEVYLAKLVTSTRA